MVKFSMAAREDPDILVDVDLPAGGVVLDVGAYHGSWSKRILARADKCGQHDIRVYAFEPAPDAMICSRSRWRASREWSSTTDPRLHMELHVGLRAVGPNPLTGG
jgi:hypothetical protein